MLWVPGEPGTVEEVADEAWGVSPRSFRAAFPAWDRRLSQQQHGLQAPSLNERGGEGRGDVHATGEEPLALGTSGVGRDKASVTEDVRCCR